MPHSRIRNEAVDTMFQQVRRIQANCYKKMDNPTFLKGQDSHRLLPIVEGKPPGDTEDDIR